MPNRLTNRNAVVTGAGRLPAHAEALEAPRRRPPTPFSFPKFPFRIIGAHLRTIRAHLRSIAA